MQIYKLFIKMQCKIIYCDQYAKLNFGRKKSRTLAGLVELLGFEPRQTEPKSVVLPLHHSSIRKECKNKGSTRMFQIFSEISGVFRKV